MGLWKKNPRQLTVRILVTLLLLSCSIQNAPVFAAGIRPLDNLERNLHDDGVKDRAIRYRDANAALQSALADLNSGEEISSPGRIKKVLLLVEQGRTLQRKAADELKALLAYVSGNREKLEAEGLGRFMPLLELENTALQRYDASLKDYLDAFEKFLAFSQNNLPALRVGRKAEKEASDLLYSAYVSAVDRHNEAIAGRDRFMADFVGDHPDIASFVVKN